MTYEGGHPEQTPGGPERVPEYQRVIDDFDFSDPIFQKERPFKAPPDTSEYTRVGLDDEPRLQEILEQARAMESLQALQAKRDGVLAVLDMARIEQGQDPLQLQVEPGLAAKAVRYVDRLKQEGTDLHAMSFQLRQVEEALALKILEDHPETGGQTA